MEETINNKAYAEVYDIIQHSSKEIQDKIPRTFIRFLKENMSEDEVDLNYCEQLSEQLDKIQYDTRIMLGIIYRDFLCDALTKEKLILQEKKDFAILEIQQKFAEKSQEQEENIGNQEEIEEAKPVVGEEKKDYLALVMANENRTWYGNMWRKIKEFFKRKGWVLWE